MSPSLSFVAPLCACLPIPNPAGQAPADDLTRP